ncbi:HtaA domain-containing protein [Streptomyces sp. NPDC001700]
MPSWRPVHASAVLCVSVLLTLGLAPLSGSTAHAADREVAGGRLDWGIKSSFQSYVTGPIAHGSWSLRDGSATVGDSQFRFHSATGSYDPADGAFEAGFSGGVRFLGHRKPDGSYQLDLTISRPTVRIGAGSGSGTLYADMTSKAKDSGKTTSARQVPLATLDLGGITMRGGGPTVALNRLPAKLTSEGAKAFAGYYAAGAELDPVSLSADAAAGAPSASPSASASASASASVSPGAAETARPRGTFTTAAVDWGVRRTFREYVTGPVAKGEWRLSQGAQDGGALFRFPRGKGTYDERRGTLRAAFDGQLRFRGKGLDLALSGVTVRIADGRGTLAADVTERGRARRDVPLATFAVATRLLRPENGLIAVNDAPAKLTARGAEAFGGLYRAGTAMDPVSLAVPVDAKASLPPLPDLGSAPTTAAAAAPKPSAETAARRSGGGGSSSLPLMGGVVGGALAVAAFVLLRRRRTADAARR